MKTNQKTYLLVVLLVGLLFNFCNKDNSTDPQKNSTEYKRFATEYWSFEKYLQWLQCTPADDQATLIYTLPETKNDQFYIMIGIHDQFIVGWDDVHENLNITQINSFVSYRREQYLEMLKKAGFSFQIVP